MRSIAFARISEPGEVATTTDSNGEYAFFNLYAGGGTFGTYHVREIPPSGQVATTPFSP